VQFQIKQANQKEEKKKLYLFELRKIEEGRKDLNFTRKTLT